jgi:hypothetical protein
MARHVDPALGAGTGDAIRRYDGAVDDWRARLMADADLGLLHRKAVARHRARAAALKEVPAHADIWRRISAGRDANAAGGGAAA